MKNVVKKRLKILICDVLLLIVVVICIKVLENVIEKMQIKREIQGYTLMRNINVNNFPNEPIDRTLVWSSELPEFVEEDILYLKTDSNIDVTEIEYKYENSRIRIFIDSSEEIKLEIIESDEYITDFTDFSIYKDASGENIVIYGYYFDSFYRYVIGNEDGKQLVAINKNVPLYEELEYRAGIYNQKNPECSICLNELGYITAYSKGEKISERYYVESINEYLGNGLFLSFNNSLYYTYVNTDFELKIKCLSSIDEVNDKYYDGVVIETSNRRINLYTFQIDGEDYAAYPNDWDTYFSCNGYSSYQMPEKPDFSWSIKSIRELAKEAIVTYDSGFKLEGFRWSVQVILNLGGIEGECYYDIDGYDSVIKLSSEDQLPIEISSEEEYWAAVQEIRQRYEKYYSKSE